MTNQIPSEPVARAEEPELSDEALEQVAGGCDVDSQLQDECITFCPTFAVRRRSRDADVHATSPPPSIGAAMSDQIPNQPEVRAEEPELSDEALEQVAGGAPSTRAWS